MIKRFRNAVVFALCLPLASLALAEGRPGGSSFKGGFSSQKSSAARSSSAPKQPSFGSFGGRKGDSAAPPASRSQGDRGSAMSRDLDRRAAQDRALRNWDARRDAAAGAGSSAAGSANAARSASNATPLPPLDPVLPGSPAAGRGAGGYAQPGPAPVIVRERSSNAWLWGLGGYLLGHSAMSHANEAPAPRPSATAPTDGSAASPAPGSVSSGSDIDALNASADAAIAGKAGAGERTAAAARAAAANERAMEHDKERDTVRTLTWIVLPFGFALLLYSARKHLKSGKQQANYSFERN